MIDLEDLDIFYKYDTGTFALISGMFMIATATYIIYGVSPKVTGETIFYYAMAALTLTVLTPILFYLSALIEFSEIVGKFSSGITLAVFGTLIYHMTQSIEIGEWLYPIPRIIVTGILGFATSFLFVRGVAVQMREDSGSWIEDEEDLAEDVEPEEDIEEEDKFLEEEDEPW
ncbi:MAG: hypothetical protein R6W73_04575 [Candidatus Saliniplasma sp.]